jgi:hypothetical protein
MKRTFFVSLKILTIVLIAMFTKSVSSLVDNDKFMNNNKITADDTQIISLHERIVGDIQKKRGKKIM